MSEPESGAPASVDELLAPVRALVARLQRSDALGRGDVEAALAQLTETSTAALGVERASVWRFREGGASLECLDLFERTPRRHGAGQVLRAASTPRYFAALAKERSIAAHDARRDARTSEFEADYLVPHGITSMLDAPILLAGELVGVVCHEHVGPPRRWQLWEELVTWTFADFVAMVLGAAERAEQARALAAYRGDLERLVEERTAQLRRSEEDFRRLFEAAPVALVLSRLPDNHVLAANPHAAEVFGVALDEVQGQHAPDFWEDPADRRRLVETVRARGRIDQFEARLRKQSGEAFWADVAVRAVSAGGEPALLFGVRDVTAQKRAAEALAQSREALRTIFDAAPIPMVLTGLDDAVLRYCNRRAADMFETTVDHVLGRRAPDFYENPEDRRIFLERLSSEGAIDGFAVRLKTLRGRGFWALLSAKTLTVDGERLFMVGFADLSEQKRIEEDLRQLATTDPLTGTLNRRRLFEVAEEELRRAARYDRPLCLAMLDLDHFKQVNDRFGHATGDEAIRLTARAIRATLRRQDQVGRYGGEELLVILPETTLEDARVVVERARAAVEALALTHDGQRVPLTVSAGVVARAPDESVDAAVHRADRALYQAKAAGRNRVVLGG